MGAQHLYQRPVLALQPGVLQHLEPDVDPHLAGLYQHQQQQILIGRTGRRRVEVDGERIGAFLREHGQVAQYGPQHDDIQMQGLVLAERGKIDALITLRHRIPAPGQRLVPLDLTVPTDDRLVKGNGNICHGHHCHGTHRILFFERKHGTHLMDEYGCASYKAQSSSRCRNCLIINLLLAWAGAGWRAAREIRQEAGARDEMGPREVG